MAAKNAVVQQWLEAFDKGKQAESARSSTFWFRNNFLFHYETPIDRLEVALDGSVQQFRLKDNMNYVALQVGTEKFKGGDGKTYERAIYLQTFDVHDIGLRTPFAAEKPMEGIAWHRYVLWQLEQNMVDLVRVAKNNSVKNYIDYPNQKVWQGEQCDKWADKHALYRELFAPTEPEVKSCAAVVRDIIQERVGKYLSPKEVEKRERMAARKLMKEALGLTEAA